jgi:hypothetical protein
MSKSCQPASDFPKATKEAENGLNSLQWLVLSFIRDAGWYGVTDQEIQEGLTMNPSTERPRRVELVNLGLVVPSIRHRFTAKGSRARVWKAAEVAK